MQESCETANDYKIDVRIAKRLNQSRRVAPRSRRPTRSQFESQLEGSVMHQHALLIRVTEIGVN